MKSIKSFYFLRKVYKRCRIATRAPYSTTTRASREDDDKIKEREGLSLRGRCRGSGPCGRGTDLVRLGSGGTGGVGRVGVNRDVPVRTKIKLGRLKIGTMVLFLPLPSLLLSFLLERDSFTPTTRNLWTVRERYSSTI